MPLGDHLGADQDVDLAGREARQHRGDGAAPPDGVAVDAGDARLREQRRNFRLDPLGAEADLLEDTPGAVRAGRRQPDRVVAVVAAGALRRAVDGQRHAAVRALERLPALPAEHAGGEAAPVQQHHRLLAAARAARRSPRAAAPLTITSGPAAAYSLAHVDHRDAGHRPIEHALLERDQRVAAGLRVVEALERRRGRAEHRQRAGGARPHHRDVAAVVARALLLLVGAVVLLVHDDQPEAPDRREHRRPRADDHVDVAAADAVPLVVALAVRQPAVLDRDAVAEHGAEGAGHRRRQRDLRHQQQHAPARPATACASRR